MLEFFEIDHIAEEYAGNLSGGQRKLLEMARALLTDPDMLLLDEPFAGVNPSLEKRLLERIHELRREQGLTFLLVEHDMDVFMTTANTSSSCIGERPRRGDAETARRTSAYLRRIWEVTYEPARDRVRGCHAP